MDEDLAALSKLVDSHIKGNSDSKDDRLKHFLCTLEKKYEKQKEFIRNLGCNAHVGLEEDEMANALIPEDLLSSAEKKYKAVKSVKSIPKWPHSLWNQYSCFGREKEVTTDLAHGMNQITLSLCTQQKQVTVLMLWLTEKHMIPNQAPKAQIVVGLSRLALTQQLKALDAVW